ncbi:MAG: RDD family protein [Acidobacteriota bacterium]|nr:RDD family protein [Acidobacteriota bacterium]
MSSAQLDYQHPANADPAELDPAPFALKQQAAERIAAHRARRQRTTPPARPAAASATPARARAERIAAAVAERYARSQTYRAYLAAEAERAIDQANAAADVALRNAEAVAEAQYSLLASLEQAPTPEPLAGPMPIPVEPPRPVTYVEATAAAPVQPASLPEPATLATRPVAAGISVRLAEALPVPPTTLDGISTNAVLEAPLTVFEEERLALEEEIAFRQAPVFEPIEPPQEIPANLIEFPRQLVAPRRARPRLAEGPLADAPADDAASQLRIFEVQASQIQTSASTAETVTPEWTSILLGAHPAAADLPQAELAHDYLLEPRAHLQQGLDHIPQTAPVTQRLMAAAVDSCLVLASFVGFTGVFALTAGHILIARAALPVLGVAACAVLLTLAIAYQLLCFTFADATVGMRYARLGLCTLSDDNPTRSQMRRRVWALLIAGCPLGIGLLWAALDMDRLGWHDRISRMYPRAY